MPTIRRLYGWKTDAVAGGSDYDTISGNSPVIPDANVFYPVTGGNFDPSLERIDRNSEVRGRRANTSPLPFRSGPMVTVPVAAYRTVLEKSIYCALGAVAVTGGTAPTPYTQTITSIGFGSINLPAKHIQIVRDDLNIKIAGATINRFTLDYPLDGEGTFEMEYYGKYYEDYVSAAPSVSFSGLSANVLLLRDAKMFIDGNVTAVQDLQGFSMTYTNNLTRKWYAGRNVKTRTLGSPTQTKKLWFPAENKAQAAPDITYSMTFGNTETAQEVAQWFSQTQKFVIEATGDPLGGGYTGNELMRITIYNGVHTGGGAEALTARDDITATFEGGVFYSEADSKDLQIEFITDTANLTL